MMEDTREVRKMRMLFRKCQYKIYTLTSYLYIHMHRQADLHTFMCTYTHTHPTHKINKNVKMSAFQIIPKRKDKPKKRIIRKSYIC